MMINNYNFHTTLIYYPKIQPNVPQSHLFHPMFPQYGLTFNPIAKSNLFNFYAHHNPIINHQICQQQETNMKPSNQTLVQNKIALNIHKRKQKKLRFKYLKLRNQKMASIPPQSKLDIQKLTHVTTLDLSQCRLISLENFPCLHSLQNLDLTMNRLVDQELPYITRCPFISLLYLTENCLCKIGLTLQHLKKLTNLAQLDLTANQLEYIAHDVFQFLHKLRVLDRFTRTGRDLEDFDSDSENGQTVFSKRKKSQLSEVQFTEQEIRQCQDGSIEKLFKRDEKERKQKTSNI